MKKIQIPTLITLLLTSLTISTASNAKISFKPLYMWKHEFPTKDCSIKRHDKVIERLDSIVTTTLHSFPKLRKEEVELLKQKMLSSTEKNSKTPFGKEFDKIASSQEANLVRLRENFESISHFLTTMKKIPTTTTEEKSTSKYNFTAITDLFAKEAEETNLYNLLSSDYGKVSNKLMGDLFGCEDDGFQKFYCYSTSMATLQRYILSYSLDCLN